MLSFTCRDSEALRGILLLEHLSRGNLYECRGNSRSRFGGGGCGARYFGVSFFPVILGLPLMIDFYTGVWLVSRFTRFSALFVGGNGVEVRRRGAITNIR